MKRLWWLHGVVLAVALCTGRGWALDSGNPLAMPWTDLDEEAVSASEPVAPVSVSRPVIPPGPPPVPRKPPAGKVEEFRTPPFPGRVLNFTDVDLDGDGTRELVLVTDRSILVWRYQGDRFVELTRLRFRYPYPPRLTMAQVLSGDLEGDGVEEVFIFISAARKGGLFRWKDGTLDKAATLHAVPVAVDENGRVLQTHLKTPFVYGAQDLRWHFGEATAAAEGVPALGAFLALARVNHGGVFWVALDENYKLKVLGQQGFKTFHPEKLGLGLAAVPGPAGGGFLLVSSAYVADEAGDHLRVTGFDGARLAPLWQGEPLGGRLLALRHYDYDGDGVREIVALGHTGKGEAVKSFLVALDLSVVPELARRGVWR